MSKESSTWISDWNPEDAKFWESKGKFIARRNLAWSILAEHLGFSIWLVWSIVATKLPQAGFTSRPISSSSWWPCRGWWAR